jgi:hypothetical protein
MLYSNMPHEKYKKYIFISISSRNTRKELKHILMINYYVLAKFR